MLKSFMILLFVGLMIVSAFAVDATDESIPMELTYEKYCGECGADNLDGVKYCNECGEPFGGASNQEVTHPPNHLETNITAPLTIRYEHTIGGTVGPFVSAGYFLGWWLIANVGIDIYPMGNSQGFYVQLECPYMMPLQDDDNEGVLIPGALIGYKVYVNNNVFLRLGVGYGTIIDPNSEDDSEEDDDDTDIVIWAPKIQANFGFSF